MRVRIIINAMEFNNREWGEVRSEVFRGDIEIENDHTYLTKISVIADGEPQPICDIPFSLGTGYYMWIPPDIPQKIRGDDD